MRGTAADPLDQPSDQGHVALFADLAAQPQARLDHHRQRHPHDAALFLDAQLIGLHLPQVAWLFDQVLVHGLPLSPRAGPPRRYGALVKPKRRHNRLRRTPMGEQGHHQHHGLGRGAQPIEDGAFAGAERLVTRVADEALLLLRMDTDIALACLASGRAMLIGAECRRGVHACPPSSVGERTKRSMSGPPFALQVHLPTVACGATTEVEHTFYSSNRIYSPVNVFLHGPSGYLKRFSYF